MISVQFSVVSVAMCGLCMHAVESWWSLLGTEYLLRLVQVSNRHAATVPVSF